MKMIYNGTPVKSLNIKHYEMNTNSATMVPSDLQAGVTAFAKGKKVTGTGKSFEFANYGGTFTNFPILIPTSINVIEIASTSYPIRLTLCLSDMKNTDFSSSQDVGNVLINDIEYPISVDINNNILQLNCDQTISLEVFYGKDNYV